MIPLPVGLLVDQPAGEHQVSSHGVHRVVQLDGILVQENVAKEAFMMIERLNKNKS